MQCPNVLLRRFPVLISKSACVIAEKITNLDQQVCTCVLEAMCLLRVYIGAVRTISLSGPLDCHLLLFLQHIRSKSVGILSSLYPLRDSKVVACTLYTFIRD